MMPLLPLCLSPGKAGAMSCDMPVEPLSTCRFCGCFAGSGRDNIGHVAAPACVLCGLAQNLVRPRIDQEACIVWIPELSQPAVNVIIRRVHLVLRGHGERVETDGRPTKTTGLIPTLYHVAQGLLERRREAAVRLGTSSPSDLADALLRLPSDAFQARNKLLGGARLLSLGRFYDGATDIYPEIVDSWASSGRTSIQ
jgi:intracellular multiplication protein IcmJ